MRFLVVWLPLQKPFQRTDRLRRFLPFQLEDRELLRRDHQLAIGFLALPLDPWGGEVREELAAMDRDGRAVVRDRVARASRVAGLTPASQRAQEHFEIDVDRGRQR